jgi:mediator of RNA polymerase II transcription subunit 12
MSLFLKALLTPPSFSQKSAESFVEISCLTLDEFFTIRNTLEGYGDLSMLADVLSDAANSDDVLVLASAVDTLNRHFDCFCVIGASADLFRKFFEAFLRVRQNGQFLHDLTFALIEVGHRLPGEMNTVVALRQEFSKSDRKFAVAACSPVSDHMADALNDANPSFNDEMDQFLSSGNSMDESTLMSVFQKLIQQLELCDNPAKFQSSAVCHHLMQLRSFNPKQFDLLLIRWIEGLFRSSNRPKLATVLAPLIGIGCVTLPAFSALVRKVLSDASARSSVANLPQFQLDFIELFVPGTQNDPCNDLVRLLTPPFPENCTLLTMLSALIPISNSPRRVPA